MKNVSGIRSQVSIFLHGSNSFLEYIWYPLCIFVVHVYETLPSKIWLDIHNVYNTDYKLFWMKRNKEESLF